MILDDIIHTKKVELGRMKSVCPLAELRAMISDLPACRDFKQAISRKDCAIIAEIKRRSPSRGILREDFDHLRIANIYASNGATALSILTDNKFFGGDISFLSQIRDRVSLPLLRKDFIIDEYQIFQSRAMGADAVLLIAAILSPSQLRDYGSLSLELGLHPLFEIHSDEELQPVLQARADIIGINNRDLKNFTTDLGTAVRIAASVPRSKILISESGVRNRGDIEILQEAGIRIFLIGETLMNAPDIGLKLRSLLGRDQ
ncbi:MAG: indole-3-glycerol phosphate synthase TrpC [Smithellaceae bacterium]|nr:indole-3-glycerol phosphate synthase TrpC [Smithellaceae bacterium]